MLFTTWTQRPHAVPVPTPHPSFVRPPPPACRVYMRHAFPAFQLVQSRLVRWCGTESPTASAPGRGCRGVRSECFSQPGRNVLTPRLAHLRALIALSPAPACRVYAPGTSCPRPGTRRPRTEKPWSFRPARSIPEPGMIDHRVRRAASLHPLAVALRTVRLCIRRDRRRTCPVDASRKHMRQAPAGSLSAPGRLCVRPCVTPAFLRASPVSASGTPRFRVRHPRRQASSSPSHPPAGPVSSVWRADACAPFMCRPGSGPAAVLPPLSRGAVQHLPAFCLRCALPPCLACPVLPARRPRQPLIGASLLRLTRPLPANLPAPFAASRPPSPRAPSQPRRGHISAPSWLGLRTSFSHPRSAYATPPTCRR